VVLSEAKDLAVRRSADDVRVDGSDRVAPATHRPAGPAHDNERRWSGAVPAVTSSAAYVGIAARSFDMLRTTVRAGGA
ncbi:MAG TPA: hypothetical protein VJ890_05720, partial [Vineibacter sp.]|nr:hypothetical protein [Vineibacter sp.]